MANSNHQLRWNEEDAYWRDNFRSRPYASSADKDYDYFKPGYRYGYEAAERYQDRNWNDVETDLSQGWSAFEHRGSSTWEQVKEAAKDAWERVTGRHTVGTR